MRRFQKLISDQRGFTMISVVTGMMVIGMFSIGAYSAALGDISLGRKDQDRKRALEAAKAGIGWYAYHLYRSPNFWTKCDDIGAVQPGVSIQGQGRPADRWRSLPNNSEENFQVELMTATGAAVTTTDCKADPGTRLLSGGVLKIRSTGRARGQTRQLVATFRRNTFLDYLWYTNWETSPPAAQSSVNPAVNCNNPRSVRRTTYAGQCSDIQFPSGDALKGPMHTEDNSLWICGSPTFGRNAGDAIEVARAANPTAAYEKSTSSGCTASQVVQGTTVAPSKSLDLPPNNAALASEADFTLTGQSCVTFNGNSVTLKQGMTWNGKIDCDNGTGTTTTEQLGADTVIYAKKGVGGCEDYARLQTYPATNAGCGDIAVRGSYGGNVTIGAADDIVVVGDLTKPNGGNQMMGLIANDNVRVYHPAYASYPGYPNVCQDGRLYATNPNRYASNYVGVPSVNTIDAAVLALTGSFIVDNWGEYNNDNCGSSLGTLNVTGNIAQYWRGPVGTGSCGSGTGYCKNYKYDDRLKYRQPPSYLDPEEAAWHMLRQSEASPVR